MANEYGKDWRLFIGDGSGTEVFTALSGETSFSFKRASQEIDLSDKDSGIYGSKSYGLQSITISYSGNLKLPDTVFARLFTVSKSGTPELNVQIKKGAIVKFASKVGIGNFSAEFAKDGPVTWSCDLSNVDAPTVDSLTATS